MQKTRMQGLFVLGGIALVVAGFNGSHALVAAGSGLICLAIISRLAGRKTRRR